MFTKWETEVVAFNPPLCQGKLKNTMGKILTVIGALTRESEKFIRWRAKYITILGSLPTAKTLCSELNEALFYFTFALKLSEKERWKRFSTKGQISQRSVYFEPSKSQDEQARGTKSMPCAVVLSLILLSQACWMYFAHLDRKHRRNRESLLGCFPRIQR